MSGIYLDTSALGRVLLGEPDAPAIIRDLAPYDARVASRLLGIELQRLALRHGLEADAAALLGAVSLVPLDEPTLTAAESLPPSTVATLDAIHLATALALSRAGVVDGLMTYDARLAEGARQHGLDVLAPV